MNDAQSVANMNLISSLVWSMDSERPEYKALWWALPILKAWMTMRFHPSTSPGETAREEEKNVARELERMAAERYAGSDAETLTTAAEMLRSPADIRMRRIMQARPDESTPEAAQRMASDLRQANALLRDADSTRLALSFVWPTMREMVGNRPDERPSDLLVRFVEAAKEERSAIRATVKARDLETTPEAVQNLARSLSDAETCISEVRRLTNAEPYQTTDGIVWRRMIELRDMAAELEKERSLRPAIEAEYPEMRRIVGAKDGEGLLVALRRFAATWLQWEKDLREAIKAKPGETVAEAARRTVEDAMLTPDAATAIRKEIAGWRATAFTEIESDECSTWHRERQSNRVATLDAVLGLFNVAMGPE